MLALICNLKASKGSACELSMACLGRDGDGGGSSSVARATATVVAAAMIAVAVGPAVGISVGSGGGEPDDVEGGPAGIRGSW